MKVRDSGMPDEAYWESLFDVPLILSRMGIAACHDVAEVGCGYGTFSIPVAKAIGGTLYALDIEPEMVARTKARAGDLPIVCQVRDVLAAGYPTPVDAVLLFNVLHGEEPVAMLRQAAAALRPAGSVHVIHWRTDLATPRGPSADMRPTPAGIAAWAEEAGLFAGPTIDLPPWHYGVVLRRP